MDNELRHKIIYLILASIMLYTLYIINFKNSVLNNPISSAIVSISFFSVITIIILSIYPELLDPNRNLSKIDDYIVFISTSTFLIINISLISSFGTDDMEYIYQALTNLLNLKDPYGLSYYPYLVSPTYLINGKIASSFIYPPFSFLVYLPFYLIIKATSAPGYLINIVNVIFDVILITLIYLEGRKRQDPFAVLPVIFLYILMAVAIPPFYGVNIVIPATFLLLSFLRDDKLGGVSLGLASSFSQLTWLAIPFLLIYKFKNSHNNIRKFLFSFIFTILFINIPFLAWNYKAFISNVLTTDLNTIPVGEIGLTVINYSGLFQLEPWFFTFSEIIVSIFFIYIYYKFFNVIKLTLWIYPMIISWFLWRTLTEYFFLWIPLIFAMIFRADYRLPNNMKFNVKKDIGLPFSILLLVLLSVGVYAHETYVISNPIKIVNVEPLGKQPFSSMLIEVKNSGNKPINITLVRVSLPDNLNMIWNFTYTLIPPNSTSVLFAFAPYYNETINSTIFTIEVYSYYYFTTYKVNISNIT